jgi:hypothetical protein
MPFPAAGLEAPPPRNRVLAQPGVFGCDARRRRRLGAGRAGQLDRARRKARSNVMGPEAIRVIAEARHAAACGSGDLPLRRPARWSIPWDRLQFVQPFPPELKRATPPLR